jgi:hypothetical protein
VVVGGGEVEAKEKERREGDEGLDVELIASRAAALGGCSRMARKAGAPGAPLLHKLCPSHGSFVVCERGSLDGIHKHIW